MPRIHPTATIDPKAELAADVKIGPYCVIEADVKIGPGTVLRESVIVRRYTSLGSGNLVDAFTVLGGEPQDRKFKPDCKSFLRIGDNNIFREGVTISRATGDGAVTTVGNGTYWMNRAHAGHNAIIDDGAMLVNGCAVGGHATVGRRALLSANVLVHQYCWYGELVMSQGNSGFSTHVPPFVMVADINNVVGLNLVGLRRAEYITEEDRRQIKEAFRMVYRSGLGKNAALEKMDACTDWGAAAGRFRDFIRRVLTAEPPYKRGLCPTRAWRRKHYQAED